jgi:2TM domain-containing protein
MVTDDITHEQVLRDKAVRQLKKKRDFYGHLLVYALFNGFLVVIWAITSHGFFWPVFPIVGWGIAVALNAWDVYGRRDIDEDQIRREMERLSKHG